jgi:hypothetical protein
LKKWPLIVLAALIVGSMGAAAANANGNDVSGSVYQRQQAAPAVSESVYGKVYRNQDAYQLTQAFEEFQAQINQAFANLKDEASFRKRLPGSTGIFIVMRPLSNALGMPQDEIVSALSKGQTIASLASARGTTVTAIQNAVLNSVQRQLTDTVSKGRLTQNQASQVLQSISSGAWIAQLQDIRQYQATSSQTQAMKDALNNLDAQIKSIMQHRGAK